MQVWFYHDSFSSACGFMLFHIVVGSLPHICFFQSLLFGFNFAWFLKLHIAFRLGFPAPVSFFFLSFFLPSRCVPVSMEVNKTTGVDHGRPRGPAGLRHGLEWKAWISCSVPGAFTHSLWVWAPTLLFCFSGGRRKKENGGRQDMQMVLPPKERERSFPPSAECERVLPPLPDWLWMGLFLLTIWPECTCNPHKCSNALNTRMWHTILTSVRRDAGRKAG